MKTITKEIFHPDFGHSDVNLKRNSKWGDAIDAKIILAQETLNKAASLRSSAIPGTNL